MVKNKILLNSIYGEFKTANEVQKVIDIYFEGFRAGKTITNNLLTLLIRLEKLSQKYDFTIHHYIDTDSNYLRLNIYIYRPNEAIGLCVELRKLHEEGLKFIYVDVINAITKYNFIELEEEDKQW